MVVAEREGERVTNWLTKTWASPRASASGGRGPSGAAGRGTARSCRCGGRCGADAGMVDGRVGWLVYVPKCCWMKLVFVGSGAAVRGGTRQRRSGQGRAGAASFWAVLGGGERRAALYQSQPGEMVRAAAISKQRGAKFRRPVESSSSAFC